MSERCIECGALLLEGKTCQGIFDEFLSLEYTNPVYGQVHFLTVACFMIQHGRYSDEGLAWIQPQLRAYLEEQRTIKHIRQIAAQDTNRANRSWKVTRQADAPPLPEVAWSMTIADVVQSLSDAEQYCNQVTQWARSTVEQMASLHRIIGRTPNAHGRGVLRLVSAPSPCARNASTHYQYQGVSPYAQGTRTR